MAGPGAMLTLLIFSEPPWCGPLENTRSVSIDIRITFSRPALGLHGGRGGDVGGDGKMTKLKQFWVNSSADWF